MKTVPKQKTSVPLNTSTAALNSVMDRTSRYVSGGTTEVSQGRLEWWERTVFTQNQETDTLYVVEDKTAGRLNTITAMHYGSEDNWWVIAQYNNVLDTYGEIQPGVILRIPAKSTVDLILQGRIGGNSSKRELQVNQIIPIV